ncbi:alpha/beta hydrolase, partial [Escherichia coli]|nr:alpha/beta hydrolase [Escherichia coli]
GGDHIDAFSGRYENLYRDAMINFIQTALSAK